MTLENPKLDISNFSTFETRLTAIEAALGMTNADVLSDAVNELSSGLFMFNNQSSTTNLTKVMVLSKTVEAAASTKLTKDSFLLNGVDSSYKCFPVAITTRVRAWGSTANQNHVVPSAVIVGDGSAYYNGGSSVSFRVFHQLEDGTAMASKMVFTVYLLVLCTQDYSV